MTVMIKSWTGEMVPARVGMVVRASYVLDAQDWASVAHEASGVSAADGAAHHKRRWRHCDVRAD